MDSSDRLSEVVASVLPRTVELRHLLHRHPEPAYKEIQTTALIATSLTENGISFNDRKPGTGLWLDIGESPTVAFRADLDALPILEPEGNVPRSLNPGWMHACGHDAHAAIAFGIALAMRQLEPNAGVRIIFQPAEEASPGGAETLVAEGITRGLKAIVAFHVDPSAKTGVVGLRAGPITASADKFNITLHGPGGHTARPHKTVDLISEAGRLVYELAPSLMRTVDPRSPLAIAFGSIHAGQSGNVIPARVDLQGTARTLDPDLWETLPGLMDKAVASIVTGSGATYEIDYMQAIGPVVNDGAVIELAAKGIESVLGIDAIRPTQPSMGGEDFSSYLTEIPGALMRLGTTGSGHDLHSPGFTLDEATIGIGIRAGLGALSSLVHGL